MLPVATMYVAVTIRTGHANASALNGTLLRVTHDLLEAGVGLFPISDEPDLLAKALSGHSLSLVASLADIPEPLSPILSVIPGQRLAMYLAQRRRGGDLDKPRGL
jgi:glucosamine 6-phosphate synthetase-like amidotransferase/phosphosugar isomerase protein